MYVAYSHKFMQCPPICLTSLIDLRDMGYVLQPSPSDSPNPICIFMLPSIYTIHSYPALDSRESPCLPRLTEMWASSHQGYWKPHWPQ